MSNNASNPVNRARAAASKAPGGKVAGEFKEFLLRGNVVDLAVAVVIGAAFGAVVTAFVSDFITPLTGIFMSQAADFSQRSFTIGGGVFKWGHFVNALLSFLIISAVVFFFVVKPVTHLMSRNKTETDQGNPTKECSECLSNIPEAARRCAFCTSEQPSVTA